MRVNDVDLWGCDKANDMAFSLTARATILTKIQIPKLVKYGYEDYGVALQRASCMQWR